MRTAARGDSSVLAAALALEVEYNRASLIYALTELVHGTYPADPAVSFDAFLDKRLESLDAAEPYIDADLANDDDTGDADPQPEGADDDTAGL